MDPPFPRQMVLHPLPRLVPIRPKELLALELIGKFREPTTVRPHVSAHLRSQAVALLEYFLDQQQRLSKDLEVALEQNSHLSQKLVRLETDTEKLESALGQNKQLSLKLAELETDSEKLELALQQNKQLSLKLAELETDSEKLELALQQNKQLSLKLAEFQETEQFGSSFVDNVADVESVWEPEGTLEHGSPECGITFEIPQNAVRLKGTNALYDKGSLELHFSSQLQIYKSCLILQQRNRCQMILGWSMKMSILLFASM